MAIRWTPPMAWASIAVLWLGAMPGEARPPHDQFAAAARVQSLPFEDLTSTTEAGTLPHEPQPCGHIGATLWYTFTPEADLVVRADTFGSDFDTVLAAYVGSAPRTLEPLACNDDTEGLQSALRLRVVGGVALHFQVGGFDGATGLLAIRILEVKPPANDNFADSLPVTGPIFEDAQVTTDASLESREPIACADIGNTVWYRFSPAVAAVVLADTFQSDFDTVLAVHRGTGFGDLEMVACNNDFPNSAFKSRVEFVAEPGSSYWFQAGGSLGLDGHLAFRAVLMGG